MTIEFTSLPRGLGSSCYEIVILLKGASGNGLMSRSPNWGFDLAI